jgi:phosphoglycolate phosphatase
MSKPMTASPLLVLDLDGTLVDSLADLTAALNRLLAQHGLPAFAPAEIAPMVGDGTARLLERALAARGRAPKAGDHARFIADYSAHAVIETRLYPGVEETLATLKSSGWRFAICTNKPEAATKVLLQKLNLAHWFAAVGGGDSLPARKPHPAHLLGTIAAAGGTRECAVMAGDHANDVAVAKAARMPSIFAAWGYGLPAMAQGAKATARHFPELAAIVPHLLP